MVQIFDPTPVPSTASMIGSALGQGLSKRLALSDAEQAFQKAEGDPLKLATAFARLTSASPELARGAGPMYQAMLAGMRSKELAQGTSKGDQFIPQTPTVGQQPEKSPYPSITERDPLEATRKPYIPRPYNEIVQDASKTYPKLFSQDPQAAIQQVVQAENQNIARSEALQAQRIKQEGIETTLKNKLDTQINKLGIGQGSIAGNLFSKIQDKAIKSILPKSEGGEGLTEQQASKKYGDEIDSAARDYNVIKSWGGTYTMGPQNVKTVSRNIDSARKNFKKRNDLENFADLLVAENGLSNTLAYNKAYPIEDFPEVMRELKKLPKLKEMDKLLGKISTAEKFFPAIAKAMGKEGSPLSIAQELRDEGYDVESWLKYLDENREQLGLTERQIRELGKTVPTIPNLQDIWFKLLKDFG